MKKKRAIALRKLCGHHPHHPKQYHAVPTGAVRVETHVDPKGEKKEVVKDIDAWLEGQRK